jgi:hypothetical protein
VPTETSAEAIKEGGIIDKMIEFVPRCKRDVKILEYLDSIEKRQASKESDKKEM